MISVFFPVKKLRRNGKYLLVGAILLLGVVAVYHEMIAANSLSSLYSTSPDGSSWRGAIFAERDRRDHQLNSEEAAWRASFTPQTWKSEYKGQANLHVFEDWCGSSVADLRKNVHYPLYPHTRTTVKKLAVSPQWNNYGLRIFGYLHPHTDGEFVFALSSDDNSEFWLSVDDSPLNLQLLVWVGKTGTEWTAPGEFDKYASQTCKPVRLSAQRKYFFELIHKQDHRGTDHVEVAWQLLDQGFRFTVIESNHISLYVNESALIPSEVAHVPQTAASHQHILRKEHDAAADMLKEDPRDVLYQVPLINSKFLRGILPDCLYKPSYVIKDFPLMRYQGLQFVHLSYIYPNDYTRLTHMETQSSCFYHESPYYGHRFGFSRYMSLDRPEVWGKENAGRDFDSRRRESVQYEEDESDAYEREKETGPDQEADALFQDYGDDYDDYAQKRRRKLFSVSVQGTNGTLKNSSNTRLQGKGGALPPQPETRKPVEPPQSVPTQSIKPTRGHLQENRTELNPEVRLKKVARIKPKRKARPAKVKSRGTVVRSGQKNPVIPVDAVPTKQHHIQTAHKTNSTQIQRLKDSRHVERAPPLPEKPTAAKQQRAETGDTRLTTSPKGSRPVGRSDPDDRKHLKEMEMNVPLQKLPDKSLHRSQKVRRKVYKTEADVEPDTPPPVFDPDVNWSQTFQVRNMDLQSSRHDWDTMRCNISGNMLLHSADALTVVQAFMDQLNAKHHGQFTLVRVVNVVKRVDRVQGSRYLLELELKDVNGQLLRLSHYIYTLIRYSGKSATRDLGVKRSKPQMLLCNPVGFHWNPGATVHFILPVKNQARWVLQLIADMEKLFRDTGDTNFNLIITDYSSTDMDVRKALQESSLPRYEYVKLSGNFERSAGLQAGISLINDDHSIVFLCDLHIHYPSSIIDTIRKHCVEGHMAFAPILMRLDCGATPSEAKGYWEVNGFGLLGIYKSDLDAAGGMNTREYRDSWGGEDWELIDRILQAGLEVERIYLRNFFHYFHSKRGMWNHRIPHRGR